MATMTASQIAQVRAQRARSFQDSATIRRAVDAADGRGGYTQGWATVHATVACSVTTPTGTGPAEAGMIPMEATDRTATIALPVGTNIKGGDRVATGSRTWEAVRVDQPGGLGIQVTVYAVEVTG